MFMPSYNTQVGVRHRILAGAEAGCLLCGAAKQVDTCVSGQLWQKTNKVWY
jgi:hypothetical protein